MNTKNCVFCGTNRLFEVIDFGEVALAGAFLHKDSLIREKKYPLALDFCEECYIVQVRKHIDPAILFRNDYYFSSAIQTLKNHFILYAEEVTRRFIKDSVGDATVLEFGCNDGVLLTPLADQGIANVIGVDPASNIVKTITDDRLTIINDFFNLSSAKKIVKSHGRADIIMANNVYAHISEINNVTEAIQYTLKDDGVFIFEVHYLGNIIEGLQYDFIYHEHIYYYSLIALQKHMERHGLVIFDLKQIDIHGGSVRYYVSKINSHYAKNISSVVLDLAEKERRKGYDKKETYISFAKQVASKKDELMTLLNEIKSKNNRIVGYGASGRANTIMQYCNISTEQLDYIVDDAPAKKGLYTPGSHILIKSREVLLEDQPDFVLIFAWAFVNEIIARNSDYQKNGGKFIVPLPNVKFIT